MRIGIIGLPQSGKKTLYQVLTQHPISDNDLVSGKKIQGVVEIKDPRFDNLVNMYKPKKEVRARIDIELLPKIEKEAISKGDVFQDIAELDAICCVVRCFKDEAVYHIDGFVDGERDIETLNSELILNDMLFIEKRLERIENNLKKIKDEATIKEKELILRMREHLDKNLPLNTFELSEDERTLIASYPFITRKKIITVLNVSEEEMLNAPKDPSRMSVCAKIESEISSLETEAEKKELLEGLGIKEPAVSVLTRLCIKALDLISFFTVGADEVRQWTIPAHSIAPAAAGSIHTDMERGFIRAEVIKYADLIALGTEAKVKEAGKAYLKGKDYVVEDGDLLDIRFNV